MEEEANPSMEAFLKVKKKCLSVVFQSDFDFKVAVKSHFLFR